MARCFALVPLLFVLFTCSPRTATTDVALHVGVLRSGTPTLTVDQNQAKILFQDQFGATDVKDVRVTTERVEGEVTYFLFAEGTKRVDGQARPTIMRFPTTVVGRKLILRETELLGEACVPTGASTCAFTTGGGCQCLDETGAIAEEDFCNHTVVKGRMSR